MESISSFDAAMEFTLWALQELQSCLVIFAVLLGALVLKRKQEPGHETTRNKKLVSKDKTPQHFPPDSSQEEDPEAERQAAETNEKLQYANRLLSEGKTKKVMKLYESLSLGEKSVNRRTAFGWFSVVVRAILRENGPAHKTEKVTACALQFFENGCFRASTSTANSMLFFLTRMREQGLVVKVLRALAETYPEIELNQKTYVGALTAVAETGDAEDMAWLVGKLEANKEMNELVHQSELFYAAAILSSLNNKGEEAGQGLDQAEHYAKMCNERALGSSRIYQMLLRAYAKENHWDRAMATVKAGQLNENFTARVKLNLQLKILCEQGNVEEATKLMHSAEAEEIKADEFTYYHLMKLYASLSMTEEAENVLSSMEKAGISVNTACFVVLLDLHFKTRSFTKALKTFDQAKQAGKTNLTVYAQMVRNFTYAGQYDDAIRLFKEMNDSGYADFGIYSLLVSKLMEARRRKDAWQVLQDRRPRRLAEEQSSSVSNCMTLISQAGALQCLDAALEVFELCQKSKKEKVDTLMYNNVLDACISCKAPEKAVGLFKRMQRDSPVVPPDSVTFNTMIRAFAQTRNLKGAFALFEEMKDRSVLPNVVTFNSLVHACVSNGAVEEAWGVLPKMQEFQVSPDSVTYATLIGAIKQDKSGRSLERGFKCLEHLKQMGVAPDEVLFNSLMDTCIHFGKLDSAEAVFKMMGEAKIKPTSVGYSILMKGYGMKRDLDGVLRLKAEMEKNGVAPNSVVYGCLIDTSLKLSAEDVAENLFAEMEAAGLEGTVVTYSLKIKLFGRQRKLQKAFEVLDEMEQKDLRPSAVTFNSLMDTVARCREMQYVPRLLRLFKAHGVKPDLITFSTICKGYCQVNDLPKALETFEILIQQGHQPDEIVFNSLLDGCARVGDPEKAAELMEQMRKSGIAPSNVSYSILVKAYGTAKQLDKAFETLEQMRAQNVPPGKVVYTCLIQACTANSAMPRAMTVFEEMQKKGIGPDGVTYGALLAGCVQEHQLDQAMSLVRQSVKEDAQLTSKTFALLEKSLTRLRRNGDVEELNRLKKEMPPDDRVRVNSRKNLTN